MTATRLRLSVVVCVFPTANRRIVRRTCDAVLDQLGPDDELLVVVDYSPELRTMLSADFDAKGHHRARVIANRESPGLSGARNSGVVAAVGEVIAFVDDDAMIGDDWADRMLAHYEDGKVSGVGGLAVPEWSGRRPRWLPEKYFWVVGCSYSGLPTGVTEVRNFIGCNMSFRRSVFEAVGGFHTAIQRPGTQRKGNRDSECAETELCVRYRHTVPQARLLFDPDLVVRHMVDRDRATMKHFRQRCFGYGYSQHRLAQLAAAEGVETSDLAFASEVLSNAFLHTRGGAGLAPVSDGNRLIRFIVTVFGLVSTAAGYLSGRLNILALARKDRALVAPMITRVPSNVRRLHSTNRPSDRKQR